MRLHRVQRGTFFDGKKTTTYAIATCQPPRTHANTDFASGYWFDSATPADDPNQIIEPPKPTAYARKPQS